MRSLKRLNMSHNRIQEVPLDFGILNSSLECLDFSFNLLTQMSVSLCRGLGYLRHLNLSSNRIKELSDKIRELSELEYLNLSYNRLVTLNYEICNDLKSLQQLYLNNNYLDRLPLFSTHKRSNTPHSNLQSSLSSDTSLKRDQFCFNLPNLLKIDLSSNKFSLQFSLYTTFALSYNLTEINLASNRITFIDTDSLEISQDTIEQTNSHEFFDDDKARKLSTPKHRLNKLKILNMSNNELMFTKGGFVHLLCNIFKLAPNFSAFIYDQLNGNRLGTVPTTPIVPSPLSLKQALELTLIRLSQWCKQTI